MQVGLTSSSLATGGAHSAAVSSSTVAPTQAVRQKLPATASEYPASPLITTRPQRYSVQLNDQLTTLQQADHYLGQLEQQLLDYRHSQRKGGQLHQQADGISFSTTEKQWPHIERTLSVRTDGDKSAFMPLKTFAEPSEADRLAQSLQQGGAGISQTLESINQQRAQMAVQQEKARQLIDGMSRFPQTENAVQASENLGGVLDSANHNYQVLLQAVNGQARISSQTVRNLLG
ncbi:flagellar hook-associated protein [Escherichia coli]|nr:flagellar hook-associated protein [Escherichia coli]EEX1661325.1 flagellar hook-associated protein [Escherichia coli]